MLLKLIKLGATHYDVCLFDTFEGMTRPGVEDTSRFSPPAIATWTEAQAAGRRPWDVFFRPELFNFDAVRQTVLSASYPASRIHYTGRIGVKT